MSATTDRASPLAGKKPRLALFLATGFGLGYLPLAPGTWGSLGGLALLLGLAAPFLDSFGLIFSPLWRWLPTLQQINADVVLYFEILATVLVAVLGVWASERAAKFLGSSDPHQVVVDEISGMGITLVVGLGAGIYPIHELRNPDFVGFGWLFLTRLLNWKYLLLGFILFRVFDIWKPFPVRQAEHLPGGWGIMADDWVAAIYAALGLWLARALGL